VHGKTNTPQTIRYIMNTSESSARTASSSSDNAAVFTAERVVTLVRAAASHSRGLTIDESVSKENGNTLVSIPFYFIP
jgi:hypothetical protein